MTQEEKQLLLKDLCARLPFGIVLDNPNPCGGHWDELISIDMSNGTVTLLYDGRTYKVEKVKPYLRPMSSMTAEEREEIEVFICDEWFVDDDKATKVDSEGFIEFLSNYDCSGIYPEFCGQYVDWLNAHHFDYRGLIPMGLALEAPEGMYNKEESEEGSEIPIPKTVDEAVKTLAKILSKEDRDYLLENGAISMHDSLGRWIRNEWGLWTGSDLKNELMNMNKGLNHPDDMSNYLIEEFIKYWNNKI